MVKHATKSSQKAAIQRLFVGVVLIEATEKNCLIWQTISMKFIRINQS